MLKKFIATVLAVILSFGLIGTASAYGVITFDFDDCQRTSTITLNENSAICKSYFLDSNENYASITVTQSLEKVYVFMIGLPVGDPVAKTVTNTSYLSLSRTVSNLSEGTYRVKSVFTVTKHDGSTESRTVYSEKKTY